MRPTRLTLLAAVALALGAAPVLTGPSSTNSGLEKALDELRTDSISADIHFLASDDMRGRDTPSPELRVAARYIRARLPAGFVPGTPDGWFDTYDLAHRKFRRDDSAVVLGEGEDAHRLIFAEDYFFSSSSDFLDLEIEGNVVFCGEGTRSDFKTLDLKGSWAFCFDDGKSAVRRRRYAERSGAVGILIGPRPADGSDPFPEEHASVVRFSERTLVSWPTSKQRSRDRFPEVYLTRLATLSLLEKSPLAEESGVGLGEWTPPVGQSLEMLVSEVRKSGGLAELENVCALWPGDDPKLADEVIIVSAHYDHVGVRGEDVYNGADDNASGTTGLLAIADALASHGPLRRSVLLIWVSGEEKGLFGSRAWAEDPPLHPGQRPVCNINIDMIGRNAPGELYITPSRDHAAFNGLVLLADELCAQEGFDELGSADEYYMRSDHAMFAKLGIPVAFLFNGEHVDYHQPSDTPDKIDCDKIRRVSRLVVRMLAGLQGDELDL